ncbi:hypothetical protein BD410DRAFT_898214 [Rickenella mellea]|uniref:Uncharacterized protein n=1 Tax=Rickenella mellea TaxID=50990 RepID=A0A4Y7Q4R0_9AGAM|nr:hypothetical protein BD410DRAFT_898214 [Rickenella mellea]
MTTLPHLVGTNFVPSSAQIPVIRQIVTDSERKLKATDDELSITRSIVANLEHELLKVDSGGVLTQMDETSLKARTSSLRQQLSVVRTTVKEIQDEQERLQKIILGHKPLLDPARRVPPEVLSEIFLNCLPNDRFPRVSLAEVPLLIGQVCRLWREVSLKTAWLWVEFDLVITSRVVNTELMKLWLARSASHPLSFKIHPGALKDAKISMTSEMANSWGQSLDNMVRTLCEHTYRWKSIDVELPPRWTAMLFFPLSKGNGAPILETIRIEAPTDIEDCRDIPVDLSLAPRLTTLGVHGHFFTLGVSFTFGDFMSQNLRDFSITGIPATFDQFMSVLHHCRFITRCNVNLCGGRMLKSGHEIILMPYMETMQLFMHTDDDPGMLLDKLQLPEVKELEISLVKTVNQGWPHATQLLQRSGSQLESFYMSGGAILETDVIALLHTSPTLRSLTALNLTISDAIMTELTNEYGTQPLCPCLQIITLSRCWALSAPSIVRMIRSRCLAPAISSSLTKVTLWTGDTVSLKDREIAECVIEGLELIIEDGDPTRPELPI